MEPEVIPPGPDTLDTEAVAATAGPWRPRAQLRSLLRPLAIRDYRLLWSAQVASELGDWATRLALLLLVYHDTHSAVLSASVVTVSLASWAGLGQVLTTAVDHLPRRTVMIVADLVRAAIFGLLVLPAPLPAIFTAAFVAGLFTVPFEAARHAIRVEITDDSRLGGAITLFLITAQVTTMAGFALGGGLVAVVGAHATFAVNAASFVASACFVARIRTTSAGRTRGTGGHGYLAAAFRFVSNDPVLRWCTVLSLSAAFAGMGVEAIAAPYGHGNAGDVTLLAVAVPVGIVVASTVAPHSGPPRRLLRAAGLVPLIGGGLGAAVFLSGPGLVEGVAGFALAGVAVCVPVPAGSVVARRLESAFRAPAFSMLNGATLGGQAAGAAVGGLLAEMFGPRPTCVAACTALALVGLAASARLPDPAVAPVAPTVRVPKHAKSPRGARKPLGTELPVDGN
jgi:MFS family permease